MLETLLQSSYFALFLIIALGFILGRIQIKGLSLDVSAVIFIALLFGHFGVIIPKELGNFGLVLFIFTIGIQAGPGFFDSFRSKGKTLIILTLLIVGSASLTGLILKYVVGIDTPSLVGLIAGALTSTPGLAVAIDSTHSSSASIAYGIAYPFGVLCVVLFVQLIPKLYHVDLTKIPLPAQPDAAAGASRDFRMADPLGLCSFALAALLGILLGSITIPLPGGASCSLGLAGGPLFAGLIVGHFGHVGPYNLRPQRITLDLLREGGMLLFLLSAGVEAGSGFVEVLQQYGFGLFLWGVVLTAVPMLLGFIVAHYLLKLDLRASLGAICGGMTSTPSLGTLLTLTREDQASSEAVSVAYAGAYPVALIILVIFVRFLVI